MEWLTWLAGYPLLFAFVSGLWGGILKDIILFTKFKSFEDAYASWSFKVALFTWLQSALGGFVGALGVTAIGTGAAAIAVAIWRLF